MLAKSLKNASKILVRLPAALHNELKSETARAGSTLNGICVDAFRRRLAEPVGIAPAPWPALRRTMESSLGPRLDALVLFGSRARGEASESSDTDLLLCLAPGVPLTRELYSNWDDLADQYPEDIPSDLSPHFSRLPESPESAGSLWLEVAIDGIVLWDRTWAVARFLASVRRYLLSGKVDRKMSYGVPYWVRNYAKSAAR